MTAEGNCTKDENKCLVNTFCPTTDASEQTPCKPCTEIISSGLGCNCVADTKSENCQTCASGSCSSCVKGFALKTDKTCEACSADCADCESSTVCKICKEGHFLQDNKCQKCPAGCTSCSDLSKCTACDSNLTLSDGKCLKSCESTACTDPEFCDPIDKLCKGCETACAKCFSKDICGKCNNTLVPSIVGQCSTACTDLTDNQFCNAGTATACVEGLTSACKCGTANNCASCTTDAAKCETCLPGFKKVGDDCTQCSDGYVKFETLCIDLSSVTTSAKLSGGAITGIVIGVIVVVGGVAGGLAYYFIKKNKK